MQKKYIFLNSSIKDDNKMSNKFMGAKDWNNRYVFFSFLFFSFSLFAVSFLRRRRFSHHLFSTVRTLLYFSVL